MEGRQDPPLQRRGHVDKHIAATDEIHMRERRVGGQVLAREDAALADRFVDAVEVVFLLEEAVQPLGRELGLDALGIEPGAGPRQRAGIAEIGGEDLERTAQGLIVEELPERDGQRIGLLARGAPRHPQAQRHVRGLGLQDLGEDAGFQGLEQCRVPKEARHVDQEIPVQRLDLGTILLQPTGVGRERGLAVERHAAQDAPADRGVAVLAEIDPGDGPDRAEHAPEVVFALGRRRLDRARREVGVVADLGEPPCDALGRQHEVHRAAADGALRHAAMARRARLLGEGDPADRLDFQKPERPVRARAREHHADGLGLLRPGERAQEVIDRQVRTGRLSARGDLERALGDRHAGVGQG